MDCLAQVGTLALTGDDGVVDLAGRDIVSLRGVNAQKALVMAQVQVGLGAVFRDVAFAVLVRVQRAGVYVNVRVEFLYGDSQPASLQEFGKRRCHDALAQG